MRRLIKYFQHTFYHRRWRKKRCKTNVFNVFFILATFFTFFNVGLFL